MSDALEVAPLESTLASIEPTSAMPVAVAMNRPSVLTVLYAPRGEDQQQPHEQDEVYVVAAGTATIEVDGEPPRPLATGDALFVAANVVHRFVDISDDFAAWAVFPQT